MALMIACIKGHKQLVEYHIGLFNIDTSLQDMTGDTASHRAVAANSSESVSIIEKLWYDGVDINAINDSGNIPLMLAV